MVEIKVGSDDLEVLFLQIVNVRTDSRTIKNTIETAIALMEDLMPSWHGDAKVEIKTRPIFTQTEPTPEEPSRWSDAK